MLDVGWSELLLIGVVALIVVGPEDLPRMFHTLGRMTAKVRSMAREFSSAMEDAAKQSGIKEAADSLNEIRPLTSKKALGLDALDKAAERFEKWDPKLPTSRATIQRDPAEPSIQAPMPGAAASPASVQTASGAPGAPGDVAASARETGEGLPHGEDAPGRRTLKAVRRNDMKA